MITARDIFPFFYPTTVMFVDDDPHYLTSLGLGMRREGAYRLFISPDDALDFLDGRGGAEVTDGCVSVFGDNPDPVADHVIRFDLRAIARTLFNPNRFDEVSVVVVNYDMPGMNGVEFCRRLAGRSVKKLMLTGSADERVAVEAFNEGVIDGYLSKGAQGGVEPVLARIAELQRRYFADLSRFVGQALAYDHMEFVRSTAFRELFERLCDERGVVEYYVSNEPAGLVLVDGEGRISLLAVRSDAQMEEVRALAVEMRVEKAVVVAIAQRRKMPVFWWGEGSHEGEPWAWERHLFPAEPLDGEYYYALVEGVEQRVDAEGPLAFNRFLERQRAEQQAAWSV